MNVQNEIQGQTQTLNAMAPEGEQLAYINEQEAGILKLLGGSGDMTPQGIPSFARGRKGATGKFSESKAAKSQKAAKAAQDRRDARETPKPAEKNDTKEQNIFQKILGGNDEVKAIAASVNNKINEVKNDPNLSNYKKQQMIKQLNFAKSGEGRKTGYSMGELSKNIMRNVDQNRLSNIRLSGKDAEMLAAQGVITQDQLTKGLGLIEDYGRGLSFDPVTGALTTAQPTVGEVGGDISRRLSEDIKNLPSISPLGFLMKALGKGGDEEEKAPTERETDFQKQVQDILYGTGMGMGPGQAIAMYGKSTPSVKAQDAVYSAPMPETEDEADLINELIERAMIGDGSTSPINIGNYSKGSDGKFSPKLIKEATRAIPGITRGEAMGGLNASFFDPALKGIGYSLGPNSGKGTDGFVNQDIIGQSAMTPQMSGAINRAMNPRDNQSSLDTKTDNTLEEKDSDEEENSTYPYFGYQRQFQTPMSFQDILNRAYTSDPDRKNMLESFADMFARLKKDNA